MSTSIYWTREAATASGFRPEDKTITVQDVTVHIAELTDAQDEALVRIHENYGVTYDPMIFHHQFDLPPGYVAGWVGNQIYVGVSPEGEISS